MKLKTTENITSCYQTHVTEVVKDMCETELYPFVTFLARGWYLYRKLHGSRSINEKSHACLAKYL